METLNVLARKYIEDVEVCLIENDPEDAADYDYYIAVGMLGYGTLSNDGFDIAKRWGDAMWGVLLLDHYIKEDRLEQAIWDFKYLVKHTDEFEDVREEALRVKKECLAKFYARLAKEKNREEGQCPGYVYIIQGQQDVYKIGRSGKPVNRISTLGVQLPFEIEPIAVIPTPDMVALEQYFHERFSHSRLRGEWFNLDIENVAWMREFIPAINEPLSGTL